MRAWVLQSLTAGADGFLAKPLTNLAVFQEQILSHLPMDRQPNGPRQMNNIDIEPDPLAYRDDMSLIADVLGDNPARGELDYLAQFVTAVARTAHDDLLQKAGIALATARSDNTPTGPLVAQVARLLQERLARRVAM